MRTRVFIPPGHPPGSFAHMYLDDCLTAPPCPTQYLAKGYVEMNAALREAHERIHQLEEARKEEEKRHASYRPSYAPKFTTERARASREKLRRLRKG